MSKGKVYLIGSGPGDPELLTLKGKKILEQSDCVIYDRLVNSEILSFISPEAEMIFVGKKPGEHSFTQNEINKILVKKGQEKKIVARLKGGDPFVFGRGGEECEVLAENSIDYEVIPGITSAIAVPAYAGIPVTHRDYNSSVTFVTGHEDPTKTDSSLNWEHLASAETLVFLMGMGNLKEIAKKLIEKGRHSETPVALIREGTTSSQKTIICTLKEATEDLNGFTSPAIIVIGNVVKAREKIKWYEKSPLFSRTILVTRARAQASILSEGLRNYGARVIEFPVIKIKEPDDYGEIDKGIDEISDYEWLIFTSQNGVKIFLERLYFRQKDVRVMGHIKLCAIGSQTAKELKNYGLTADYIPEKFIAEELIKNFPQIKNGTKILIPRAKEGREIIQEELKKLGAYVKVINSYETVAEEVKDKDIIKIIKEENLDIITFTSSSTVKNFVEIIEKLGIDKKRFDHTIIAAIGPVTANTAKRYGFNVKIMPFEYTIEGLTKEIVNYYL